MGASTTYAIVNVKGPALANAQLFSMNLPAIGGSPLLTGNIALNATTSPTFNYSTTEVVLAGGDPLTKDNVSWTIPTTDADFLDIQALVKGKITYSGSLFARPTVTITKIRNHHVAVPAHGGHRGGGGRAPVLQRRGADRRRLPGRDVPHPAPEREGSEDARPRKRRDR